ncbi:MAG: DNA-directed RNA polymerase subunit H [Nitrososphaerota archaeon]|nr:DNA-directed RNA polymerase subunit H [Nitrososphaerota archaeon]
MESTSRPKRAGKQPNSKAVTKEAKPQESQVLGKVVVIELMGWSIKHELLEVDEAERVLQRYKANRNQLPKILTTDPVVKKMGARPGDIIRITRTSPTAGLTVYYRVVDEA